MILRCFSSYCAILSLLFIINSSPILCEFKDKPKILYVVNVFPTNSYFLLAQIAGLIDSGFDVTIYALRGHRSAERAKHEIIFQYNLLNTVLYNVYQKNADLVNLPPDLSEYDIVFCQFGTCGEKFAELKKKNNAQWKLVTCFRGADLYKNVHKKSYSNLIEHGDLFLPVCYEFQKKLEELGCATQKITVHPSPVDCEIMFPYRKSTYKETNPIKIITVCRLIEKKGLGYSIYAMKKVLERHSNVTYTIVGPGKLKQSLRTLVVDLGLERNVFIIGSRPHDEVAKMIYDSDIALLGSVTALNGDREGIPNFLKEAMSCGLPIIATDHSGIHELVDHNINGFLVPERDIDSLANRINYLIKNTYLWDLFGASGRQKVFSMCDVRTQNKKIVELLYDLINKKDGYCE